MEIAIVLIIALVIFGPKRLPELGKSVGSGFKEFKASIAGETPVEKTEARVIEPSETATTAGPASS
jgi:sec-independent protein translocase protein TatA